MIVQLVFANSSTHILRDVIDISVEYGDYFCFSYDDNPDHDTIVFFEDLFSFCVFTDEDFCNEVQ